MWNYDPEYVYMFPVAYKNREIFFENITKVPAHIRGAFLLDEEKKDEIEFSVYSPSESLVLLNTTSSFIFDFNATVPGSYKIVFDNRYSNTDMKVTFTMNTGQNEILKKEDLSATEEKQKVLLDFMSGYSLQLKMRGNAHHLRYKSKTVSF